MLVAQFFGTNVSLPSGYATPAPVAQATAPAVPTAAIGPTQGPAGSPTAITVAAPTAASAPTLAPSQPPAASPEPTVPPTATPALASDPNYIEYTVQRGDILKDIAQRHGVTIGEIMAVNQIPNPDSLVVASVIRIPRK
jgi:LysM repeat protein